MIAEIGGEILGLYLGLIGLVFALTLWFIRILAEFRERITRLETKVNGHYWHHDRHSNEREDPDD